MEREKLGSRLGFILLSAGCAIGCGNVWKFPWMCGQYGGGGFVLLYFFCLVILGLPIMIMEFCVGRAAQASPIKMYQKLEKKGQKWHIHGYVSFFGSVALMAFYTVVTGWIVYYFVRFLMGNIQDLGFSSMITNPGVNVTYLAVTVVLAFGILCFGLQGGLERVTKYMMMLLLVLMLVLAVHSFTLSGAAEGLRFYLVPDFSAIDGGVIVAAMNQAFFSLSVAGNGSVIYGSYLSKSECIPSSARNVALFDTIAALLAAFVIIPAMAAGGAQLDAGGPGLMFVYLVNVFNAMPGGRIVGMIFYICVLFAGVSSIVNLYEAPVAFLQEKLHTNRVLSVVIIGAVGGVIALCIQPWTSQWMDVVSIYICPLGALLAGIMFFWVMKKDTALAAVHEGRTAGKKDISGWFYPLGKWVYCAASLAALILGAIYGGIG